MKGCKSRLLFLSAVLIVLTLSASWASGQEPFLFPVNDSQEQRSCLACHRQRNINTNEGILATQAFCNECHSKQDCLRTVNGTEISLKLPKNVFEGSYHQYVSCTHCHTDVANTPHRSETGAKCRDCHQVHGEEAANSPHLRVSCQACHFDYQQVILDQEKDQIQLARLSEDNSPLSLAAHKMTDTSDEKFCSKCHFIGNNAGAPASVLPNKSFLCLACHNAPLKIGYASGLYWTPLVILLLGLISMFYLWFKGSVDRRQTSLPEKISIVSESVWREIFSRRFFHYLRTLFFDILLQRKILREGLQRWTIHSLIYLAFLARLGLSLFTLIIFNISPDSGLALTLVNKNSWFVAFAYDLLGLFIIAGILWAAIVRFVVRPAHLESREQDTVALIIIGILVLTGFILEGARILITQIPEEIALRSFAGYVAAQFLSLFPADWQNAYAELWYVHAFFWAAFIAYLPFGKLKHIITTPLNLILNTEKQESGP